MIITSYVVSIIHYMQYLKTSSVIDATAEHSSSSNYHSSFLFFLFFKFYFIFKLYNIVLVLPNIEMNPSQVYMFSPS